MIDADTRLGLPQYIKHAFEVEYPHVMALAPESARPQPPPAPIVEPKPQNRHCWVHRNPIPGSEGQPAFLLGWAHSPGDVLGRLQWWAQIVIMTTPVDWSVEWVTADLLSLERFAGGHQPEPNY